MSRDALVVGINNYDYDGLKNLNAPAADAEAIAKQLEQYGEFKVTRLPAVKDKQNNTIRIGQETKVTLNQLKKSIVQLFKPESKHISDTALLYFSGHGLREELGISEGFLATSDVNPKDGKWGLSLQWLQKLLLQSEVRQQIIILDCCYSGEVLNCEEADPGDRGKGRDRCFIAASRAYEVAYEDVDGNHSVLTSVLLKGLESKQDQWVTNYDLIVFINQQDNSFPQRPIFANSGEVINLIRRRTLNTLSSTTKSEQDICPYKGLAYFDCTEEDTKYFYGRTVLTDQLLEKVRTSNFLTILGASGSGKSSVVRAGLLYQLKLGQRLSGSNNWQIRILKPAEHPLQSLASAFTAPELPYIERYAQLEKTKQLIAANGAVALENLIKDADTERVVLVVDQFEEAFTLCQDIEERKQFFECLLGAVRKISNKLCLVLTMRADFLGKCLEQDYAGLAENIKNNMATVTPLNREELRDAIIKPAELVGLNVEEALVQKMIADVQDSPGSLPLLQYALTELWELWHQDWQHSGTAAGNTLTFTNYVQIGEVEGALEKQAEKVYNPLLEKEQAVTKRIFLELTQLGEGTEDTRRRILKNELINDLHPEELLDQVIRKLADARLLVTNNIVPNIATVPGTEQAEDTASHPLEVVLDVAHEALIRHWKRLRSWIDENRDALRTERKLKAAGKDWQDHQQNSDYLWSGARLAEADDYYQKYFSLGRLDQITQEFIQVSRNEQARQEQEKDKQIQSLNQALTESQMREKAARVQNLIPTQPLDALLLAVEAVKTNLDWISNKEKISEKEPIPLEVLKQKPGSILGVVQASLSEAVARAIVPNVVCERHQASVSSIAFSSEGEMIVGDGQNMVYFWDSSGKKTRPEPLRLCTDKSYTINSIAFSSKLKKILSGCFDGTILVWNFDGKLLHTLQGHTGTVNAVAFSLDGEMIVSASSDKTLRLWNTKTGESIGEPLGGHEDSVNAVAFSPDGKTIASGSKDKTILLWNISDQFIKPILLRGHEDTVYCVAFSRDGQMIVSGSQDTTVRLWTIKGSPIEQPLRGHTEIVYSVAFSPDGKTIASGSRDTTVRLWTIEGSPIGQPLRKHEDAVYCVAFSPDGQMIVSGSSDKTIIFWAIINHNPIFEPLCKHENTVNAVAFSPNGEMIVSASSDKTLRLWNTKTGESIGEPLDEHEDSVNAVAFSSNGEMIVSASSDKTLRLWNTKTGESIGEPLGGHEEDVSAVAFSPDGEMIVSGSYDSRICLWNIQGQCISQVSHNTGCQISSVMFSPNGEMIVSGTSNGQLCLWKINNNRITPDPLWSMIVREKEDVNIGVSCVAFSPNGEMIVSGNSDGKLRLWNLKGDDIEDTEPWVAHPNDNNGVTCIAFSPDGQMIASGGSDRVIQLWDIKGNRIGETSRQHEDIITSIAFSRDGKWMATSSVDKKIYLWRGGWRDWLEICCKRLAPIILEQPRKDMDEFCEICVTYKFWSSTDFAAILKKQGDFLANPQQKKKAEEKLRKAEEYDSDLKFEPKKLEKLIAYRQIESLRLDGRISQIKEVIEDLCGIDPTLDLFTPSECDELCWFGSLYQCQDDRTVMAACEKAVESDPENGSFRATRGVAKVLRSMKTLEEKKPNSEIEEAIEDFNAYIADKNIDDKYLKQRCQQWINALRAGKNPFTEEEIKKLLET